MPDGADAGKDRSETGRADEDRRRSRRFICGGDAKVSLLPSDGIFLPGKILDLSLHGCRVDTTLPINCGVRAEIVLRVNAASFRAVGEVRAIRGGSGAGIEFVQLSNSGKDMLADVIQELARLRAIMHKFKSCRLETDTKSFATQLEEGRVHAARFSARCADPGTILAERRAESSESNQSASAEKDRIVEAQPLVIAVDLFV
jgi:hypothetical protein